MYERRKHRPLPMAGFVRRLLLHGAGAAALILVSLLAGMAGMAGYAGLELFAGCYAPCCGLGLLHTFHWEE